MENKWPYVRDVAISEDHSTTRTGHAPANLATCRNLVIGTLRAAGRTNIAHTGGLQGQPPRPRTEVISVTIAR